MHPGLVRSCLLALGGLAALASGCRPAARPPDGPAPAPARIIRGEGWAIAAPEDWSTFDHSQPPMVLYLVGDARQGIPPVDGVLSALKAGLTVEVFPRDAGKSPRERAEGDLAGLKSAAGFEIQSKPVIEETTLSDGTKAHRVRVTILRPERRRLSLYEKIYCSAPDGRVIVATGFLTCSPGGGKFLERTGLAAFLRAHVGSLVLDADRIDRRKLEAARAGLNRGASEALRRAQAGNRLLGPGDFGRAAAEFREALTLCDAISAAHNGLAWALLQDKGSKPADVAEAVKHAEAAVELTDRRDPAALDTLALACFRHGDRDRAVATIREALALKPDDPDMKRALERYQKGP